jgi:hypothetical protein
VTTCHHLVAFPTSFQTITSTSPLKTQVGSNFLDLDLSCPSAVRLQRLCLPHSGIWRTFSSLSASHVSHGGNKCRRPELAEHSQSLAQRSAFSSSKSSLQSTGTNGDMGPKDWILGSALGGSRTTHCTPDRSQSLWHPRSRGVDPQGSLVTVVDSRCATFHSRVCLCTLNLSFLTCMLVLRSSSNGCTSGQVYQ